MSNIVIRYTFDKPCENCNVNYVNVDNYYEGVVKCKCGEILFDNFGESLEEYRIFTLNKNKQRTLL